MLKGKYLLHGSLQAQSGKGQELADILLNAAVLLEANEDCILYVISTESTNIDEIWISEIWTNKQSHDDSLKNEELRALIMQAMPLLANMPQKGKELTLLGGKG